MSRFSLYSLILVGLTAVVVAVGADHPRFAAAGPEEEVVFDAPYFPAGGQTLHRRLPTEPVDPVILPDRAILATAQEN
jgi:hypothetical protein